MVCYASESRQPLVIAAEGDQDYLGLPDTSTRIGSSWIITSVVPRSDLAVYDVINATLWGLFEGASLDYDLQEDVYDPNAEEFVAGVAITQSDFINLEWIPPWIWDEIDLIRADIIDGTITVSDTYP